jgi:hypothetical protein
MAALMMCLLLAQLYHSAPLLSALLPPARVRHASS